MTRVLFWYVGASIVAVLVVFDSSGLDHRLIALGAIAPLIIDLPVGHMAVGHTLVLGVALLAAVMVGTIGRSRLLRRRLLCVPIGFLAGLLLSGAFLHDEVFLWPFIGDGFGSVALLPPLTLLVLAEGIGVACCGWIWSRCGLADPDCRAVFLRTGRLTDPVPR
ncbi:MAG: hypothetical protein ACKOZL_03835 [Actinomycetes bacterium]